MAGNFYAREVGVLAEQVLQEISKFAEILGKLSMGKQSVPGSFLPTHAREPGNEATERFTVALVIRRVDNNSAIVGHLTTEFSCLLWHF